MTTHIGLIRAAVVLLFIITFTLLGWAAPALYASNAPSEEFIEVHEFTAEDTTTTDSQHLICFDRTVQSATTGQVFTELYLIDGKYGQGGRTEVSSETMNRYFQKGKHEVVTPLDLPSQLSPGEYRYLLIIRMQLADGRVTRDFVYRSEQFTITEPNGHNSTASEFAC